MKESCIRRLDNKTVGEWDDRNAGEPERDQSDELIGTAFDFFFARSCHCLPNRRIRAVDVLVSWKVCRISNTG